MVRSITILFIALVLVLSLPIQSFSEDDVLNKFLIEQHREDWKKIDGCVIFLGFGGDNEKKIGLNQKDLHDYAKLKFKNNFSNVTLNTEETHNNAVMFVKIFTVGEDYPIAFNVEVNMIYGSDEIFSNEYLGITNEQNINERIKSLISSLIQDCAIQFYKVRGEL